jgi:hypothetical protein
MTIPLVNGVNPLQTTLTELGIVSGRVALLLRSAEIQPVFVRFVLEYHSVFTPSPLVTVLLQGLQLEVVAMTRVADHWVRVKVCPKGAEQDSMVGSHIEFIRSRECVWTCVPEHRSSNKRTLGPGAQRGWNLHASAGGVLLQGMHPLQ